LDGEKRREEMEGKITIPLQDNIIHESAQLRVSENTTAKKS
jgi:hypothetical protein